MQRQIKLSGWQFIVAIGLMLSSVMKIFNYKRTGCINPWRAPIVCGEGALYYYYLYIGVFILGLILFFTSFKKIKSGDDSNSGSSHETR